MAPLVSIQVLRALAALAVAYGHAAHDAARLAPGFSAPFQGVSGAGVDLFFAISGFVMVISSARLFAADGGRGVFIRRRLARIVPIYWVATTLFLLTLVLVPGAVQSAGFSLLDIIKSYLFVPFRRADSGLIQPAYGLGWTLNYEMFFYGLFALALVLPAGRAVGAVVGVLAAVVIAGLVLPVEAAPLVFWSDPIVLEFAFGALIGLGFLKGLRLPPWAGLLLAGAGLAVFFWLNGDGLPAVNWQRPLLVGLPLAAVLAGLALMRGAGGPALRVLALVGDASYALYLFHPMVIRVLSTLWVRAGLAVDWGFIIASLGLSAVVAMIIFRLFERPVTQALQAPAPKMRLPD